MRSAATIRKAECLLGDALKALFLNDDSAEFNYGNVLLGLQRLDDAFAVFDKALTLNRVWLRNTLTVAAS